jgi:hypothetical protein
LWIEAGACHDGGDVAVSGEDDVEPPQRQRRRRQRALRIRRVDGVVAAPVIGSPSHHQHGSS